MDIIYKIQNRKYELIKIEENIYRWIARKLPKRLVYFVTIELWAKATSGDNEHINPTTLCVNEALDIYTLRYDIQ